jgi:hypothetical protein
MFRLASKLGCTVGELPNRMSYEEFIEWTIFYKYEPWGSSTDDTRNAVLAATVANSGLMVADPKTLKRKPFKYKQFLTNQEIPSSFVQKFNNDHKKSSLDPKQLKTKMTLLHKMSSINELMKRKSLKEKK